MNINTWLTFKDTILAVTGKRGDINSLKIEGLPLDIFSTEVKKFVLNQLKWELPAKTKKSNKKDEEFTGKIFGYEWSEIQAMQQGEYKPKTV